MFLFPSNHAPPARSPHDGAAPGRGRSTLSRRLIALVAMVMTIGGLLAANPAASVEAAPPAGSPPTAKYTRTPGGKVLEPGATITLDASQSWDIDGDAIDRYTWEFSGEYLAIFSGKVVEVKLPDNIDYFELRLTVIDSTGAVGGAPLEIFRTEGRSPVPDPDSRFLPKESSAVMGTRVVFDGSQTCCTHSWEMSTFASMPRTFKGAKFAYQFRNPGDYTIKHTVTDQFGRSSTTTRVFTVKARVPMAFVSGPTDYELEGYYYFLTGTEVKLSGELSQPSKGLTYSWTIDNQPLENTTNEFKYTFKTAGTYAVKLTVTDEKGQTSSDVENVIVLDKAPALNATFKQSQASPVPVNTKVTFDGSASTGQYAAYTWRVNGKKVTNDPILHYTFDTAGIYDVELEVWDGFNKKDFKSTRVQVGETATATFTQTPNTPTVDVNSTVKFDGSGSTGDNRTYAWTISGVSGIVGDQAVLNYEFKKAGNYNVQLVVTSGNQKVKARSSVKVVGTTPPPTASITRTPDTPTVTAKTPVKFDGSASTGSNLTYVWRVTGKLGVAGTDAVLNHEFPKAGNYNVELIVTDSAGQWNKKRIKVQVTGTNKPPTADFTQAPAVSTVTAGTEVTFDGSASKDPDGDKLTYSWTVRGHKGVFTSSTIKYKFEKAGTYGVQLVVKDPSGAYSKKWVKVTVTK